MGPILCRLPHEGRISSAHHRPDGALFGDWEPVKLLPIAGMHHMPDLSQKHSHHALAPPIEIDCQNCQGQMLLSRTKKQPIPGYDLRMFE
jgi:hypothetical protein